MKLTTLLNKLGKRSAPAPGYDRENLRPVIRASICTGEQTAGFRNIHTGRFTECMLIRTDADLEEFCRSYAVNSRDITTEY